MSLESFVTSIVISSYSRVHPSTALVESVISSLNNITGLASCPKIIILDGYVIRDVAETKRGRLTTAMATRYEKYCENIKDLFSNSNCQVIKCDSHVGYAYAVRKALEMTTTTYAMICQHDRKFLCEFNQLSDLIKSLDTQTNIRYIGFPTCASKTHKAQIVSRYGIPLFVSKQVQIDLSNGFTLQPLLFWYDSNHLCHVQRYLQIYKPFLNMPSELKTFLGSRRVKQLVLRPGDFIEDRFGQMQRKILTDIIIKEFTWHHASLMSTIGSQYSRGDHTIIGQRGPKLPASMQSNISDIDLVNLEAMLLRAFNWFGSYLLCQDEIEGNRSSFCRVMVAHMDGRKRDPAAAEAHQKRAQERTRERNRLSADTDYDIDDRSGESNNFDEGSNEFNEFDNGSEGDDISYRSNDAYAQNRHIKLISRRSNEEERAVLSEKADAN